MLFMPDISMVKYGNDKIGLPAAVLVVYAYIQARHSGMDAGIQAQGCETAS
jgi:hypothetical protein